MNKVVSVDNNETNQPLANSQIETIYQDNPPLQRMPTFRSPCMFCMEPTDMVIQGWTCQHRMCENCYKWYQDRCAFYKLDNVFCPQCIGISKNTDHKAYLDHLLSTVQKEQEVGKAEAAKNQLIAQRTQEYNEKLSDPLYIQCPKCDDFIEISEDSHKKSEEIKCDCGHSFCNLCGENWHSVLPCSMAGPWCVLWIHPKARRCPHCKAINKLSEKGKCFVACRVCSRIFCRFCSAEKHWNCFPPCKMGFLSTGGYLFFMIVFPIVVGFFLLVLCGAKSLEPPDESEITHWKVTTYENGHKVNEEEESDALCVWITKCFLYAVVFGILIALLLILIPLGIGMMWILQFFYMVKAWIYFGVGCKCCGC